MLVFVLRLCSMSRQSAGVLLKCNDDALVQFLLALDKLQTEGNRFIVAQINERDIFVKEKIPHHGDTVTWLQRQVSSWHDINSYDSKTSTGD